MVHSIWRTRMAALKTFAVQCGLRSLEKPLKFSNFRPDICLR